MPGKNELKKLDKIILIFLSIFFIYADFSPWEKNIVKNKKLKIESEKEIITSTPVWVLTRFIRFYQIVISPQGVSHCRYQPTCSNYALESIKKYGPVIGLIMASDRFMRCNPFGAWGKDSPEENYFPLFSKTTSSNK